MARDVDLVIRAKDQAKKAIDSVATSLTELADVQKDVGQSASKTDGLLGKLRDELANLDKEARGLAALNKVAGQLDRAAAAVGRLDAAAGRAVAEQERLSAAAAESAASTERLRVAATEAKSAYDRQKAAVSALTAEQKKDVAATAAARQQREGLRAALVEANTAVRAAEKQEAALGQKLLDATASAEKQTAALGEANGELMQIAIMANKASAALGGVEATQEAVAAASARAAADMERLNTALNKQTGGRATVAAPTSAAGAAGAYREQVAAVNQAKTAWREAQEEANRLGAAIARTEAPTREMQTSFLLAQKASKDAKAEYYSQGAALNALRGDLAAARASTQQLSQTQAQASGSTDKATTGQRQYASAARGTADANAKAVTENLRLRQAFEGIYGESRKSMNLFQRLRGEILSLTAAYVGFYAVLSGVGTVIETMRSIEQAQNRLGVTFGQNQAVVGAEMAWLEDQASRLKMSFSDLAAEYGKFAFSAKGAGLSLEDIHTVFLGVAEGARVMGLSMEESRGILKALDQIMSKGKVQAEELRGQLGDRLSGSFRLFADAIGVSTAELDKMLEAGEVVANRSQMVKFGQKLRETFGPQLASALESTTSEISDFDANLKNAARQVGEGGLWSALGESLRSLNEWFKSTEGETFFTNLGLALGKFVLLLPPLVEKFGLLLTMFQAFAALKVAAVFSNLMTAATGKVGNFGVVMQTARRDVMGLALSMQLAAGTTGSGALRVALTALSGVVIGMRGALIAGAAAFRVFWAAVGGWPTVIISVLTFLVQHLLGKWLTSVDGLTEAMSEHRRITDKVTEGYVNAKGEVDSWKKALEGLTATEIELNTTKLENQLDDLRRGAFKDFLESVSGTFAYLFTGKEREAFLELTAAFSRGEVSAKDFRAEVDRLAQTNPGLDRKLIEPLLQVATKAADAEDAIAKNNAALRAQKGVATEADKALLGLAGAMDQINVAADTSAIDRYTAAMKKLGESIPDVKAQMDLDAARATIETTYQAELKALTDNGVGPYGPDAGTQKKIAELTAQRDRALAALVSSSAGGSSAGYIDKVIGRESGGNPNARAQTSTATGLGQFTERTWAAEFAKVMPQVFKSMGGTFDAKGAKASPAILNMRLDPETSRTLLESFTERNAKGLVAGGFAATDTNKYLAHFLGLEGALNVLSAALVDPSTPIAKVVDERSRTANASVFGPKASSPVTTAGEMVGWAAGKMDAGGAEIEAAKAVNDLLAERKKAQDDFNASVATGISQRQFEIEQMGRSTTEQAIQTELRTLETQAMQAGLPVLENGTRLTADQTARIRDSVTARVEADEAQKRLNASESVGLELAEARGVVETKNEYLARRAKELGIDAQSTQNAALMDTLALLYDINEAKRRGQELDAVVSDLGNQQQSIMAQMDTAEGAADFATLEALKLKLDEVNAAYMQALLTARDFWATQDPALNPQAAAATLQYDAIIAKQKQLGQQSVITKKQLFDTFSGGLTNAVDRFAQSVAEGKNAFESARDAFLSFAADFLRQIAQMILQAVVLKILTAAFGGGGGGGAGAHAALANVMHTGGVVGRDGSQRSVWAGAFANATRYHSGGIVGFKPNEVPIVAERGEEVLDAGDPRHRDNFGGGGNMNVKNVNVLDGPSLAAAIFAETEGERVVVNWFRANKRMLSGVLNG